jgi:hypothetical protein
LHHASLRRENTKSPRKTIKKTSKGKYRKNKARKENPTEKSKKYTRGKLPTHRAIKNSIRRKKKHHYSDY